MKKSLYALIVISFVLSSCNKDSNPVSTGGVNNGNGTVILERWTNDSLFLNVHNNFSYQEFINQNFDFTKCDSVIITLSAQILGNAGTEMAGFQLCSQDSNPHSPHFQAFSPDSTWWYNYMKDYRFSFKSSKAVHNRMELDALIDNYHTGFLMVVKKFKVSVK